MREHRGVRAVPGRRRRSPRRPGVARLRDRRATPAQADDEQLRRPRPGAPSRRRPAGASLRPRRPRRGSGRRRAGRRSVADGGLDGRGGGAGAGGASRRGGGRRAPRPRPRWRGASRSARGRGRVGGAAFGTSAPGGSSRTNEPPVRPRRVSTNPASRRICSAWRSVIGATPSWAASSTSLGRRSPGASTPAPIASPRRRTICSTAPSGCSGASASVACALEHHYL